ncbi:tyrosine-type recombinase/integrase [Arthrobacter sp. SF27]|uniref:tyrosine-type recombinase/integrase n=1 Tax=Crystallibacter degradans TaxID=2726743 RepID=UPI001476517E|nr:tyrosine-type recombinase/integrase [Arthrobacter sp. SF27]
MSLTAGRSIHTHVFRRSRAMSLFQAGVDTLVIAFWLGHADIRSTDAYVQPTSLSRRRPRPHQTRIGSIRSLLNNGQSLRVPREPVTTPRLATAGR